MKALQKYVLLAVLAGAVLAGCRDDDDGPCCDATNPECPNYDPCWNQYPTAEFKMRQSHTSFIIPDHLQAEWCDTIIKTGVEFVANMEGALSYSWQIGFESEPRTGKRLLVDFSPYFIDTLQNLNPINPDFYNPLPITLTVRNAPGACVAESDTIVSASRQLVFARKTLTTGKFRGRVEGENFDRDVILWEETRDLNQPDIALWSIIRHIGLPFKDTLKMYPLVPPIMVNNELRSYKQRYWDMPWESRAHALDGIRKWRQKISPSAGGPDRIDLYYERFPEDNSGLQTVKFTGYRIE